ncbi:hypothetical protein JVT61DRAFT_14993 [Boletus reticuloceps]|uniref:Uncharacterized protein n=1 Tax=Boletus reticuloceps TaxID=495285 RepID=A0A8I3A2N1_9AGAM|nr:hypothetical protein JVT61DRAFT_14993 [Boletus reticuloceps]
MLSAIDDPNSRASLSMTLPFAIFLGPQAANSTPDDLSDTLTLSGPVTVPLNDPAMCSDLQIMPTRRVIPPTPIPGHNATSDGGPTDVNPSTTPNDLLDTLALSGPMTVPSNDCATCNDLQMVPTRCIIPLTPAPGQNTTGNSGPAIVNPLTPTSGQQTAAVNAILTAGYDELKAILIQLIKQTNLTMQQILDGWHKSRSHTVNSINHWNHYTKYAMQHEEQERRQLGLPPDVPHSICCELYAKFKNDNPDTWQEILEVHEMINNAQSSSQTIAQHVQTFNKVKKRVISVLKSESAKYGFEAAIVMCGSVVNEDALLGFTHTMGGATTFFETRCCANSNTMIGHLKSHVYNHVSLETVKETFGDKGNQLKETKADHSPGPVALQTPPAPSDGGEEHINDDIMTNIKDSMIALLHE